MAWRAANKPQAMRERAIYGRKSANRPLEFVVAFTAALIVTAFAVAITLGAILTAKAQDHHERHHAFYQGWVNKDGAGCCNDRDCGELGENDEREAGDRVEVRIEGEWCPVVPRHYLRSGNVPNASVSHACVLRQSEALPGGPCERFICYQPQPKT